MVGVVRCMRMFSDKGGHYCKFVEGEFNLVYWELTVFRLAAALIDVAACDTSTRLFVPPDELGIKHLVSNRSHASEFVRKAAVTVELGIKKVRFPSVEAPCTMPTSKPCAFSTGAPLKAGWTRASMAILGPPNPLTATFTAETLPTVATHSACDEWPSAMTFDPKANAGAAEGNFRGTTAPLISALSSARSFSVSILRSDPGILLPSAILI
jgi:hypothetical protein